jgi:hypothetical protein
MQVSYSPAERLMARIRLGDLAAGPIVLDVGPLGRQVTVSLDPGYEQRDVEFTFADPAPLPGINPYWLRVVQSDQEMAWSSPLFVDYVAEG